MIPAIDVRFFTQYWNHEDEDGDYLDERECSEEEFLKTSGTIDYERFSIHENGCRQIVLTKIIWGVR